MHTKRGFSVLEILIAMAVLLSAMTAIMLMFPGIRSGSIDAELNAEALTIAQHMLEEQQANGRKDFKLVVATSSLETLAGTTYTKTVTVTTTSLFIKQVGVKVAWGGLYNRSQKVELSTIVANFQNVVGGDTCDSNIAGNWLLPQATHRLLGTDILSDSTGLYGITDLDVYQKRLYVAVYNAAGATTLGPLNPGTSASASGAGSVAWSNSTNAHTSDSLYTTATLSSGQATQYLKLSNLGFALPKGATVLGIRVEIERKGSSATNTIRDSVVSIVRADGTLGSSNKAVTGSSWPTSESYATYGGTGDLWNENGWSASAINSPNFGVAIAATATSGGGNRTASIDHVRVSVTYTRQFYVLDVATPTSPAFIGGLGSNSVATGFNAVAIATSTSSGSYAFAAVNSTATQVEIINIGTNQPTLIASTTITVGGSSVNAPANTIFYKDGYVYVGLANSTGPEFSVIDVHTLTFSPTTAPLGTYEVGAGVNSILVKNGYAYLGTDDANRELIVLDLQDLAHPALRGSYNAPGASGSGQGRSLSAIGDTLYLGRYYSLTASTPEFVLVDTTPANPTLLGSFDVGPSSGSPYGIYGIFTGKNADKWLSLVLTSSQTAGGKFQALDTTHPGSVTTLSSVTLPNSGGGTALDCEWNSANAKDYFYAASVPLSGAQANKGAISIITGL